MTIQYTNIKRFPPITKQQALEIAAQAGNLQNPELTCYAKKPKNCITYGVNTDDPCWYVRTAWNDEQIGLRSSRLIVISRVTGKILYDGSAGDEG